MLSSSVVRLPKLADGLPVRTAKSIFELARVRHGFLNADDERVHPYARGKKRELTMMRADLGACGSL